MSDDWFEPFPGSVECHLYCFPHAGGSESMYRSWERSGNPWLQIVPVLLPGRGKRASELALTSAEEISVPLSRRIAASSRQRSIALFGHSMGALLAYATAVALERDHGLSPTLLLVAGADAPHRPSRLKPVHTLPDDELLTEVLAAGGTPEAVRSEEEALRNALPALRADASVVETYRHSGHVLSCPVSVLIGCADPVVTIDGARRWSELTTRPAVLRFLPGDHFFVRDPLTVDLVEAELKGHVDA